MNTNSPSSGQDMTHCRWCNAPIKQADKICKHCHEYQDLNDLPKISLVDSTLSTSDWFIIFFMQFLGIPAAIVHFYSGQKARAKKLVIYTLFFTLIYILSYLSINSIFSTTLKILKMVNAY